MPRDATKAGIGAYDLAAADFHVYRSRVAGPLLFYAPSLRVCSISPALAGYLERFLTASDGSRESAQERPRRPEARGAVLSELARVVSTCLEDTQAPGRPGPTAEVKPSPTEWNPSHHPWANLTLLVTDRCNLRCRYCYEAYASYKQGGRTISREVAAAALDFFFDRLYPCADVYDLHLFGGEPLLAWDTVEWVTHQAKRRAEAKGKPLYLSISTNAIGLTREKVRFLRQHEFDVCTSLDGPREVHDAFRPFGNGRGSFDAVQRGFSCLVDQQPPYSCVDGRLHRENKDAYRSVLAAYEMTHRRHGICLKLALLSPQHPLALRAQDVEEILLSYRPLVDLLLDRLAAGDYSYLTSLLYGNDSFARYIVRLRARELRVRRCPAGVDMYIVATDGRIYPCDSIIGMEAQDLGDVWRGLAPERHRRWLELDVNKQRECQGCWARYLCGGGCYTSALIAHGDLGRPDPLDCRFTRGLIELAMEFLVRAQIEAPGHLDQALAQALAGVSHKHRAFVPAPLQPLLGKQATGDEPSNARLAH